MTFDFRSFVYRLLRACARTEWMVLISAVLTAIYRASSGTLIALDLERGRPTLDRRAKGVEKP